MTHRLLADMVGGWLVGNFEPTCYKTAACEVACKRYDAGTNEAAHVHRVATELTLIVSGRVRMNGRTFASGDIVILSPGEATDFQALEPTTTVVVKLPSVVGDTYPAVPACSGATTDGASR
jgi:hypothetical protein